MASNCALERALKNPLEVLHEHVGSLPAHVLRETSNDWGIPELFQAAFTPAILSRIPSLNLGSSNAVHHRLIRFRGMVQDSFEAEYFPGSYDEVDEASGTRTPRCARYHDDPALPLGRRAEPHLGLSSRRLFHLVSVPGEASWLAALLEKQLRSSAPTPATTVTAAVAAATGAVNSASTSRKRTAADGATPAGDSNNSAAAAAVTAAASATATTPVAKLGLAPATATATAMAGAGAEHGDGDGEGLLAARGPACVAAFYGGESFRLGEVIEVVAVAAIDAFDAFPMHQLQHNHGRGNAAKPMGDDDDDDNNCSSSNNNGNKKNKRRACGNTTKCSDNDHDDDDGIDAKEEEGECGEFIASYGSVLSGGMSCEDEDGVYAAAARGPLRLHVLAWRTVAPGAGLIPPPTPATDSDSASASSASANNKSKMNSDGNCDDGEEDSQATKSCDVSVRTCDGGAAFAAAHARLLARPLTMGATADSVAATNPTVSPATGFDAMRSALLTVISPLLGGDALASEVLLLALLSRVTARVDERVLGRFNLALSDLDRATVTHCNNRTHSNAATATAAAAAPGSTNDASANAVAVNVAGLVRALAPRAVFRSVTIDSLNARRWGPVKDEARGVLSIAPLQLARGETVVVLDETALGPGQLADTGVRNLQLLSRLAKEAVVEYEFPYTDGLRFPVDASLLVLARKRPLLPYDVRVPLAPVAQAAALPEWVARAAAVSAGARKQGQAMSDGGNKEQQPGTDVAAADGAEEEQEGEDRLWQLREYLQLCRHTATAFDEEASERALADMVARMQRDGAGGRDEERLHLLMTLARLIAASHGEVKISEQRWRRATEMLDAIVARDENAATAAAAV